MAAKRRIRWISIMLYQVVCLSLQHLLSSQDASSLGPQNPILFKPQEESSPPIRLAQKTRWNLLKDLRPYRRHGSAHAHRGSSHLKRKARPEEKITWRWFSFTSSAQTDNLELYHWVKMVNGVVPKGEYSLAEYNKSVDIIKYTEEYEKYLTDPESSEEPFNNDSVPKEVKFLLLGKKKNQGKRPTGLGPPPSAPLSTIDAYEKVLSAIPEFSGYGKLFKDPTGSVGGTIHHMVFLDDEFKENLGVGAVMVLHEVTVWTHAHPSIYLNITAPNVLKVFTKDTFGASRASTSRTSNSQIKNETDGASRATTNHVPTGQNLADWTGEEMNQWDFNKWA